MRLMMKKVAVWLLTATICFSTNAFAADKPGSERKEDFRSLNPTHQGEQKKKSTGKRKSLSIKKLPRELQEALDEAKVRIPELKELELSSASISEEDGEAPERWEFDLSDGKKRSVDARLEIDANSGLIYSYYMENDDWTTGKKLSQKQTIATADRFLKNIWGEEAAKYRFAEIELKEYYLDEDEEPTAAIVRYQLYINNIPVKDFEISLLVDGNGHIRRLNNQAITTVDESNFPSPKKALSPSKAEQSYKKLLGMSLSYEWIPSKKDEEGDSNDGRVALVYVPRFVEGAIDAFTGKLSNEVNNEIYQEPKRIKVTPKDIDLIVRSQAEAERLLTDELGVSLDGLQGEEIEPDDEDEQGKYPSYRWGVPRNTDDDEEIEVELWVDPQTGKVESYEYNDWNIGDREQNYSLEDAENKAVDTLESFLDENRSEILLSYVYSPYKKDDLPSWVEPDPEQDYDHSYLHNYTFYFTDRYQDVEVGFSGYRVEIDPGTGMVLSLELLGESDFSDLPDNRDTISPSQAAKAYVKKHPMELAYVWPTYHDQKRPAPVLLYTLGYQQYYIDAFSGKIIEE